MSVSTSQGWDAASKIATCLEVGGGIIVDFATPTAAFASGAEAMKTAALPR